MKRLALAVLLVVTLAGCDDAQPFASAPSSTSSPTRSSPSPSPTGTGLRVAVQAYSDAFLSGEGGTAYAMLSTRCQGRMAKADFLRIVTIAHDIYDGKKPFLRYREQVSGDLARVTYTFDVSTLNQNAGPWVRESGTWREDDC